MASVIFPARQNLCGGSGVILPLETTRSEVGFLLPSHICQANKPYFQNLKNFVSHPRKFCQRQEDCKSDGEMHNAGPCQVSIHQANAFLTTSEMRADPRAEYQARLSEWSRREAILEQSHLRMGNFRACFFFGVLLGAVVLCRSEIAWELVGMGLLVGLLLTGVWHLRIEGGRNTARRGMRFYQLGLERLDGTWPGKGSPGTEFLDPHHPYAADLDVFGAGSLFELVNAAHTQNGRATLAAWLLESA
jgi:hypothetical protein